MQKIFVCLMICLLAVPVFAEWSHDVSKSESWKVYYDFGWNDQPAQMAFENTSGFVAFDVIWDK